MEWICRQGKSKYWWGDGGIYKNKISREKKYRVYLKIVQCEGSENFGTTYVMSRWTNLGWVPGYAIKCTLVLHVSPKHIDSISSRFGTKENTFAKRKGNIFWPLCISKFAFISNYHHMIGGGASSRVQTQYYRSKTR